MRLIPIGAPEELRLVGLLWLVPHQNNLLAIAERLQLAHRQQQLLSKSLELQSWLQSLSPETTDRWKASDWTFALEERGAKAEPVTALMLLGPSHQHHTRPLLRWLLRWRLIESPVTAKELMNQGYPLAQRSATDSRSCEQKRSTSTPKPHQIAPDRRGRNNADSNKRS